MNFAVIFLFLFAGLLVGGAYSAYQAANKLAFWALALLSVITIAAGIAWLVSGVQNL